jgi:hypothetical protein
MTEVCTSVPDFLAKIPDLLVRNVSGIREVLSIPISSVFCPFTPISVLAYYPIF